MASQVYQWGGIADSATARVSFGPRHPMQQAGLVVAQRYSLMKNLFILPVKGHNLFGHQAFDGLGLNAEVLKVWHQYNQPGQAHAGCRYLDAISNAYWKFKRRLARALDAAGIGVQPKKTRQYSRYWLEQPR